jgi:hypothetical protein
MSPYAEPAYAVRAIQHARFMGDHPGSFPDTHGSPTIGMAYAAMGTHIDPSSFRKLLDEHRWWFSLAHTPEGNFYYQPNRDNTGYGSNPRFQASSVTALVLSLPKRNLMISEKVFEMARASFASPPAAISTTAIRMTATTVATDNGPMEYLFTETSGNPGGTSSGWQSSPTYTDTGLSAGTTYAYTVAMRDALGVPGPESAPAGATTQQGAPLELMSLNFHANGGYAPANHNRVTLEAGESAGVGPYHVSGWQNYAVPWNPGSPEAPFTLTSNLGATATFTLRDVRNGWTYDDTPNTSVAGGNADLMNSHANGTEDPYDGSMVFDMEVTGIPFTVYDLIVYLGANQAQFGDGFGKLVLNGGPPRNFTRTAGEFSGFTEITNANTRGNYLIFRGLRNPSLTLQVWGNGFNHLGPAGFQIVKDSSGVIPPGPAGNPNPPSGSVGHAPGTDLGWTGGLDAVSRKVYFGTNPTPGPSEFRGNQTSTTFDPGNLANGTYYWRIDEVNADGTTPGPVWSFTVGPPAKAFRPLPWNGMTAVATRVGMLKWVAGESATASSHQVYLGTDATPDTGEFIGTQTDTTFDPGPLSPGTTYYWRIDQVNAQGTTTGDVWSFSTPKAGSNQVKIFILAGQSNMEGHGEMNPAGTPGTLQTIYDNDPVTHAHLKTGGNWTVRDDAWIWYQRGGTTLVHGGLTAGYGANSQTIGPELQFGHAMGDYFSQKVLLIKTAWGGKSLRTDFRPPGSGWNRDEPATDGDEGYYFKLMLDAVVEATANLRTYFPTHDPADGHEIAGFAWHQGWNDRVTPAFAAEYEVNMARFIRDVRSALGVPAMPFVIATTGMDGTPDYSEVESAQLRMENFTAYPDFRGNVAVVDTQSFWFPPHQSPADEGYHWNRNAGTYYRIGKSIAEEMQALLETGNTAPVATPQTVSTVQNTLKTITLAGTDAEENPLTFRIVTRPAHGTVGGTQGNVTYRPAASYTGPDRFTFQASDGRLDSAPAVVSINVTPGGVITWGHATAITSAGELQSTGVTDLAGADFGRSNGTTTLVNNGAVEVPFVSMLSTQSAALPNGITVSATGYGFDVACSAPAGATGGYRTILTRHMGVTGGTGTIRLSGLSIGTTYQVQAWLCGGDATNHFLDGSPALAGGGGNNPADNHGFGTHLVGTFTADATEKTLVHTASTAEPVVNALAIGTIPAATRAFTTWTAGAFPSGQVLNDRDPGRDFDGGSLSTGIEWVVGGDPTNGSDDAALAPTIEAAAESGFHIVTYRLSNEAAADGATDAFIEYSTGPGTWIRAIHDGDTVRITTTPGPVFATVSVKLKDTLAPGGRLFVRLKATIAR